MTQLSRINFAPHNREYERVSTQVYPEHLKVASILSACPVGVRTQLQMMVSEETTYESLKGRIEHEAITTKWSTESVLGLPTRAGMEDGRGLHRGPLQSEGQERQRQGRQGQVRQS